MLNKQLTEQLEQEAKDYAQERWDNLFGKLHLHRKTLMMFAHLAGAKEYAEKWQEAEKRAERYEKTLKWYADEGNYVGDNGKLATAWENRMSLKAREALTPKTGSDD